MFTRSTKNFGIWRDGHFLQSKFVATATKNFVFSLGVAAFICTLIFFLSLKIRKEFFLIESSFIDLHTFAENTSLIKARPVTFVVALVPEKNKPDATLLVFDNGKSFIFPTDKLQIKQNIKKRTDFVELLGMLTMKIPVGTGRVQLWVDKSISWKRLQEVIAVFGEQGFDDIDLAVRQVGSKT